MKRRNARSFDLLVKDIRSDAVIARTTSHNTQLALTWAPDESAIVFLENDDSTNQLTLRVWRFGEPAEPQSLRVSTLSAKLPIRWAPGGQALLLYRGNGDSGELTIVEDPLGTSPKISALGSMAHAGDMRWSPDGTRVAFTSAFNSGKVDVVEISSAKPRKTVEIQPSAPISSIAWSANGNELYVTARTPGDEFYGLFRADLTRGVVSRLLHVPYDLHNPLVAQDGNRFAIEANRDGRSEILVGNADDMATLRSVTAANESMKILSISHDQKTLQVQGGPLNQSPAVFLMDWVGNAIPINGEAMVTGSSPLLLRIPASDGQNVPTIIWTVSSQIKDMQRGVIYVHGGPHLQERPVLDGRVLPAMLRDTVIAIPNYRGSSGYGATWERVEDVSQQALDIAAVLNYMRRTYGLSSDKIVVVTSSTGLRPVLSFLRMEPNSFGTLVATALVRDEGALCEPANFVGAMFGFHGERDLILAPRDAESVFDSCSKSAKTKSFRVLSDEGHLFHRTSSWAEVFAATYEN